MEKYKSKLIFEKYVVNEIYYIRNDDFKPSKDVVKVELNISSIEKIENEKMQINLVCKIFEQSKEKNYPFEMEINLTGYFVVEADKPEKYKANAIAILYPYIRAIVSTYTSSANINPLILPTINVNKLIEDQKKG